MLSWLVCLRDAKFLISQVRLVRRTRFRGAVKKVMAQLRKQNLIQVRVSRVCLFECMARLSGWHGIFLTWEYQVECECELNVFSMHFFGGNKCPVVMDYD